jgi:hypothetical protein
VARVKEIESELERRNRATLRDRESNLPKYLGNSVGAPPERPSEKHEWRKAVSAIEGYRERYEVTDEKRALGPEPRTSDQRWEREQVERHIEEHNDRRLGRSRDDDVGLERSFELTP